MKSEVKGTVRYEERGQGYREIWRARPRVPLDMKSEAKGTVRYEERGQGYREIWRARPGVPWDMKSEAKGTVRYDDRGQGYHDVEKVEKHWVRWSGPCWWPVPAVWNTVRCKRSLQTWWQRQCQLSHRKVGFDWNPQGKTEQRET
jgi:hypothetical protein